MILAYLKVDFVLLNLATLVAVVKLVLVLEIAAMSMSVSVMQDALLIMTVVQI